MSDLFLRTILGDIPVQHLGLILPHEHLFTDLRGPETKGYASADPEQVGAIMLPYLKQAEGAGVTALVECSTIGVGRSIDILTYLANHTSIHVVAPTGIYKEEYTPEKFKSSSIEELAQRWIRELLKGIGTTSIKAGFIKIALSDDGPTPIEIRNLRAAALASHATGAVIASHTIGGKAAIKEIEILAKAGQDLEKFIWVHANSEEDTQYFIEAASQGVYVEIDSIGQPNSNNEKLVDSILKLHSVGFSDRILLSHDAGWYQPGNKNGTPDGGIRGFTDLTNHFIPLLRQNGLSESEIILLTQENPKRAFAFQSII
jgi:phosphotriesterase-related protein